MFAKTDVCLTDVSSEILLFVQEDKDKTYMNPSDPEAQLIAEAIAAFQQNNSKRVNDSFLEPDNSRDHNGRHLPEALQDQSYSRSGSVHHETQTVVYRHTPRVPKRRSDGMRPLDNRKLVLRCYEAFKKFIYPTLGALVWLLRRVVNRSLQMHRTEACVYFALTGFIIGFGIIKNSPFTFTYHICIAQHMNKCLIRLRLR